MVSEYDCTKPDNMLAGFEGPFGPSELDSMLSGYSGPRS